DIDCHGSSCASIVAREGEGTKAGSDVEGSLGIGATEDRKQRAAGSSWHDDYTTPPYLVSGDFHYTSIEAHKNGEGDMYDMFMGFTLADDGTATHSSGGELIQTAGLGTAATGGHVVVMSGYGLETTSGSVTVKTLNAGDSGVSGALAFSSGTTSSGNSGLVTIGTGAATSGKGGMISVAVGSGSSGVGGNVYVKAGQTFAHNKDGGHVAVVAGTGGQSSAGTHGPRNAPGPTTTFTRKVSQQYFMTDANCKSHEAFGGTDGAGHDCGAAEQREAEAGNGPWWDDYSTPAYPGTHAQPGSHVHGVYDKSADMTDMFAGYTLTDDGTVTHSSGGEIVVAAGLGTAATGGQVMIMGGYGLETSSGSVTIKSVNAGESGVSG
ncbi:MAG: hypothetical protein VXX04_04920, partial [Actinomycetota bacterium]|nr:hypothetical protein [Actinomycetota bacterium]